MKLLCFVCTGNYYRSRFAEECFNSSAHKHSSEWRADSRGVGDLACLENSGPISKHVIQELQKRGYPITNGTRMPERLKKNETGHYDLFVCLNGDEHESPLLKEFGIPGEKILCWDILDDDKSPPEIEMERLERKLSQLVETLSRS